jgi:hypothetical protein
MKQLAHFVILACPESFLFFSPNHFVRKKDSRQARMTDYEEKHEVVLLKHWFDLFPGYRAANRIPDVYEIKKGGILNLALSLYSNAEEILTFCSLLSS